ncbi:gamma-glutamyl-CDP-amidate hydrolase [Helicobacter sp. 11S02596-1]|uniref:gamma-glutamyl-CDP-amidate hydrolase n=1 Tax=Helicobacter sp. 11S02596-1 TaxID=1476194 RepID=UPI000BA722F1|nr:gamma-glutamyl-CDP-amidate hydrolase [Helicobacter sp. 11S02596-1]PAF45187.1 hypothetical protein BJI48_01075 [Helicobacter sp. 11S02596-1]
MIGITQRLEENPSYYEIREALSCEWGEFFGDRDFLPLSYSVPFERYAHKINAVIFSGGNDLFTLNPHPLNQKRDSYETKIIRYCLTNKLPLLGVCRGAQMIAHFFGATLQAKNHHITPAHPITLTQNNTTYEVNSYHQFAITHLSDDLIALATAGDGSIEAYKHISLPIFGMMWHIEREKSRSLPSQMIWEKFLKEVKK